MATIQNEDLVEPFYDELWELGRSAQNFNKVALEKLKIRNITYKDKRLLFPLLRKDSMEAFLYALNEIKKNAPFGITTSNILDEINFSYFKQTLLHSAVQQNDIVCAKFLLEAGVDIDAQDFLGYTALHHAANFNNIEMVDLLLQFNPNVNIKEYNPLYRESEHQRAVDMAKNVEIIEKLQNHQWLPLY